MATLVKGTCLLNEPMARHTSYGIGGPAAAYVRPADREDLASVLNFANENQVPVYFAGSGSNLLIADRGVDGIIIALNKTFTGLRFDGNRVYAEAGVKLDHLVKMTIKRNLSGLENLIGIPGTLGGALIMNAGAFGSEISDCLSKVHLINRQGQETIIPAEDINFGYRSSSFPPDEIIVAAEFELVNGSPEEIKNKQERASSGRKASQPLRFRSAGSVFKNPRPDLAAGYLIDKAGLKGTRIGDAEISAKHANFFINHGHATANDMVQLIKLARTKVFEKFNIKLELEIKTLGFESEIFSS
ncbi:MAG: UDP-N-acetylmuramate dehydrogenase [FCB group bacterium]|nr:UDP-N-acetylmuramate dehydrogenase [FCB group bacterium]